jgi:hypothetical protein
VTAVRTTDVSEEHIGSIFRAMRLLSLHTYMI